MNKRTIVFDFDKTLTKKDTLTSFYLHVYGYKLSIVHKLFIYNIHRILLKLRLITNDDLKELGVSLFLKGKPIELIAAKSVEYAQKINLNHLYSDYDFKNIDEDIFIISASFEMYLKHLFPDNVKVYGSTLNVVDNKVYDLEFNCFSWSKIKVLNDLGITTIDVLYTDSLSDLPLATIAAKIFIVNNERVIKVNNAVDFISFYKT